jgi:metal-responsive CopG/Arc/MetJ family transcriptional regulator
MALLSRVEEVEKKPVSVQMETELIARLDSYVKYVRRTREEVVSHAVREYLAEAERKDAGYHAVCNVNGSAIKNETGTRKVAKEKAERQLGGEL